ncbi:MAG: efflux RND transporter periplasmic adaptor subunit [Pseudoruegeria sp.]
MKPVSILTALIVMAVLYLAILERDRLTAFASGGDADTIDTIDGSEDAVDEIVSESETPEKTDTSAEHVSVIAVKSFAQNIDNAVLMRGQTEAARQVEVRAETTGQVISDPLRKGSFVEQGQLLCEIDIGTREAALAEAEARLLEAEINNTAASKLAEGGFGSETRAAGAKASLQAAQAMMKAANRELDRLKITAPFAGLLETDTAELGSLLQQGSLCATVIHLDTIKLVGFVPETQVDAVEIGAMAGARLASGSEIAGRVTFISRSADSLTRTFRVEVTVPNADLSIRDGQTAEIAVSSAGADAHLLPQSVLTLDDEGTLGVRTVVNGDEAGFIAVTVLRDSLDGIWLTGLPAEAEVIVQGQEYVIDGVPINVTYQEAL